MKSILGAAVGMSLLLNACGAKPAQQADADAIAGQVHVVAASCPSLGDEVAPELSKLIDRYEFVAIPRGNSCVSAPKRVSGALSGARAELQLDLACDYDVGLLLGSTQANAKYDGANSTKDPENTKNPKPIQNPTTQQPVIPTPTPPTPTPPIATQFTPPYTYHNGIKQLLAMKCVPCHGNQKAEHGINVEGYTNAKKYAAISLSEIQKGSMPPKKSSFSAVTMEEKNRFQAWKDNGTPKGKAAALTSMEDYSPLALAEPSTQFEGGSQLGTIFYRSSAVVFADVNGSKSPATLAASSTSTVHIDFRLGAASAATDQQLPFTQLCVTSCSNKSKKRVPEDCKNVREGRSNPAPAPTPNPNPTPTPTPVTFAMLKPYIDQSSCAACHSPALKKGGIVLNTTEADYKAQAKAVYQSLLYPISEPKHMPPLMAVPAETLQKFEQWSKQNGG